MMATLSVHKKLSRNRLQKVQLGDRLCQKINRRPTRKFTLIPKFNNSGVLPPYLGTEPSTSTEMAPYNVSLLEAAQRFATTPARIEIFKGLLGYRQALRNLQIETGFQWLDGSFVEDVETTRGRPPKDIDIVTFYMWQPGAGPKTPTEFRDIIAANLAVFDPDEAKRVFKCDAYLVNVLQNPFLTVDNTRFWFGMFSHQRDTSLWKGMLQVDLTPDDNDVEAFLAGASNAP